MKPYQASISNSKQDVVSLHSKVMLTHGRNNAVDKAIRQELGPSEGRPSVGAKYFAHV
jgi:hypothetical protein